MRSYAELERASRPEPPFANGTEGEGWMAHWCDRCLVDAPFRNGINATGCPLILLAYTGRTPAEWLDGPRDEHGRYSIAHQYHCVEFRAPGDGGGEPRPIPDPPGQETMFPREPFQGVRMHVQPRPVEVSS